MVNSVSSSFPRLAKKGPIKKMFSKTPVTLGRCPHRVPRCPKKMQNAEVRAVRTQASPQQRSGIAIGRGGIA